MKNYRILRFSPLLKRRGITSMEGIASAEMPLVAISSETVVLYFFAMSQSVSPKEG